MKLALRYIPTEVWVDIFCYPWISRKKLGKLVDKLRNRYFADILQYCLHERGKQMLGWLELSKLTLPYIPRTPLPENIKFFENIRIWHFDSTALAFLRQIGTLFLNDVNLSLGLDDDMTKLRTILDHLSPLLHGIHSLRFKHDAIPHIQQYFAPKLAQIRMLQIDFGFDQPDPATIQAIINFCMNWLTSEERDPAKPIHLQVHIGPALAHNLQQFCMAVRQQFQSAKKQCTFAIQFFSHGNLDQVADFHLENSLGERLDGQFVEYGDFQIHRHKVENSAREQLDEWVKRAVEQSVTSSRIGLYGGTTIGPVDADAGTNGVNDAGEEEKNQPSLSEKPKLA